MNFVPYHYCESGKLRIGSINGNPVYRPCPHCRPEEHAEYMRRDPMASDEANYAKRHGTGVRPAW